MNVGLCFVLGFTNCIFFLLKLAFLFVTFCHLYILLYENVVKNWLEKIELVRNVNNIKIIDTSYLVKNLNMRQKLLKYRKCT